MKRYLVTIVAATVFLIGLLIALYPLVADFINSSIHSQNIDQYRSEVKQAEPGKYDLIVQAARDYNEGLLNKKNRYFLNESEAAEYNSLLRLDNSDLMGYLIIDKINVRQPLYHGTSEEVLRDGVGHIEGTSLPIGGASTHAVLSGHRGLPSATLLSNLNKLEAGDTFTLMVMSEVLTYEVDQILVVEPDDMSAFEIYPEKDYVTLATCTPYGVNTHRLLVRGHRVESAVVVDEDASSSNQSIIIALMALIILTVSLIIIIICLLIKKYRINKT